MNDMPKKLIIFKSLEPHFWFSCQIIEQQVIMALEASDIDYELVPIDKVLNEQSLQHILELSKNFYPQFYFLSDDLDFSAICESLSPISKADFIFPIYGNMTVRQNRWLELESILTKKTGINTLLLAASPRSKEQVDKFLQGSKSSLLRFPMELDNSGKTIDSPDNDKGVTKIVYAGRLTAQKNILELMETFLQALRYHPDLELHIAGSFHSRGYHLHGYTIDQEKFRERFDQLIQASNEKILFHGFLEQSELLSLFSHMDAFCSVSSYHDEDYGVSAVQASLSGLKLILSDWGGHAGIADDVLLIPLHVDKMLIPRIDKAKLLKAMLALRNLSKPKREQRAFRFSRQHFAQELTKILRGEMKPFEGLSDLYRSYCEKCLSKHHPFHFEEDAIVPAKELYQSIYSAYTGGKF